MKLLLLVFGITVGIRMTFTEILNYNRRLWRTKEKVRSLSLANGPNTSENISEESSGKLNAKPGKNSFGRKRQSRVKINSDS